MSKSRTYSPRVRKMLNLLAAGPMDRTEFYAQAASIYEQMQSSSHASRSMMTYLRNFGVIEDVVRLTPDGVKRLEGGR